MESGESSSVAEESNDILGMSSDTAVYDFLVCPVCMNLMYPPIQQCPNGHTLCSSCKSRVHCCPVCRCELGNIRCLALEKVAESLDLPCKYHISGCQYVFPHKKRIMHEKVCEFRPHNCPYTGPECNVTGDIPFLVSHLVKDHKVDIHNGSSFHHRYVRASPQDVKDTFMLSVLHCFGNFFCLRFDAVLLGRAPVYMLFMRFMGSKEDAGKFRYSLEVAGNGRKLAWQGVPRSIRESHKEVRDSLDGLVICRSLSFFLSGQDILMVNLKVTGRVWRNTM